MTFLAQEIGCSEEAKIELIFFCKTLGLTVEEDEEGMVVVAGWVEDSAAAEHPSLMVSASFLRPDDLRNTVVPHFATVWLHLSSSILRIWEEYIHKPNAGFLALSSPLRGIPISFKTSAVCMLYLGHGTKGQFRVEHGFQMYNALRWSVLLSDVASALGRCARAYGSLWTLARSRCCALVCSASKFSIFSFLC